MKVICPLVNEECREHGCSFYIHLLGLNPQTGVQEDKFGCSISFLPILLIENSKEVRQGAAATESFRNVVAKVGEEIVAMVEERSKVRQISRDNKVVLDGPG